FFRNATNSRTTVAPFFSLGHDINILYSILMAVKVTVTVVCYIIEIPTKKLRKTLRFLYKEMII
ncbi:MAG: hypothetical protein OXC40_06570, partial [Proteobacteria bacterium]|nr:hypothetical protein [Pseudomonadota bacterium]